MSMNNLTFKCPKCSFYMKYEGNISGYVMDSLPQQWPVTWTCKKCDTHITGIMSDDS